MRANDYDYDCHHYKSTPEEIKVDLKLNAQVVKIKFGTLPCLFLVSPLLFWLFQIFDHTAMA